MTRFNPFPSVSGKYGAPMGRMSENSDLASYPIYRMAASHQGGGEGYDRGGAYWGIPHNVWAVWVSGEGADTVQYVRAIGRNTAIAIARDGTSE